MSPRVARKVQRVSTTKFRNRVKDYLSKAKGDRIVLVDNRRRDPKYIVDKVWFDDLMKDCKSTIATLEILADYKLTERLVRLSATIDADLRAGRLYTLDEVFGKE